MKDKFPFFSIIIPTFARPRQLTSCLQAMTRLDYPSDCFEVIVVDDGSPQPMDEVVALFQNNINIKLISQPNSGPARARNTGAAHARGQFLAFTDDDCQPDSSWLQALAKHLAVKPDMSRGTREQMVGGQVVNALTENPFSSATQLLMSYLYDYYNAEDPRNNRSPAETKPSKPFFTSNNLALSSTQFKELGGFDTTFITGEDREFCDRWFHHGYQISYVPQAVIYHAHALNLRSFWHQHFHYGGGTFNYRHRRAERRQESVKVEKMTFYLNLLCYPLSQRKSIHHQFTIWHALLLVVLLFISQVANTFGFFSEMIKLATKKEAIIPNTNRKKQNA